MRWLDDITIHDSMDMNLGKLWKMVRDRKAWHATIHGVVKSWTQLWQLNNSNLGKKMVVGMNVIAREMI